jgi:hypothetical protein
VRASLASRFSPSPPSACEGKYGTKLCIFSQVKMQWFALKNSFPKILPPKEKKIQEFGEACFSKYQCFSRKKCTFFEKLCNFFKKKIEFRKKVRFAIPITTS